MNPPEHQKPPGWIAALGAGLGLGLPAAAFAGGRPDWAWGLGLGQALGWLGFWWLRRTVKQAFSPGAARPPLRLLLIHSSLRLGVLAAVLLAVLRSRAVEIWAVVLGYSLAQVPALGWQARTLPRNSRRGGQ